MKYLLAIALMIVLIACTPTGKVTTEEPIVIGFIGPLSGDGAAWGTIEKNSVDIAVTEINAEGGINGRPLLVRFEDGKCTGKEGISAAQKLLSKEKIVVLLVSCSQEVLAIAPVTEEQHVLVFASYAASSDITTAGDYIFRNSWTNSIYADTMAQSISREHHTVAILSEETEFALNLQQLFTEKYTAQGGSVVKTETLPPGEKDARTELLRILTAKPKAIILNPTGPATGLPWLQQLRALGYQGPIYANFFAGSTVVQKDPSAKGITYFADPEPSERAAAFFATYKKEYGTNPELPFPAVARYDSVQLLADAMRTVGTNPQAIQTYLYSLPIYHGLLGTYHFDENGDPVGIFPAVRTIPGEN